MDLKGQETQGRKRKGIKLNEVVKKKKKTKTLVKEKKKKEVENKVEEKGEEKMIMEKGLG